jgi:hypothetical protein
MKSSVEHLARGWLLLSRTACPTLSLSAHVKAASGIYIVLSGYDIPANIAAWSIVAVKDGSQE